MQKLLLCLVALVALAAAEKRIQVRHEPEARVTDIDRMNYDGLYTLEQVHPESLSEKVHPEDVAHLLESGLGSDWREHVEIDESEPISYLEFIRLSTSVSLLNRERQAAERVTRGDGDHYEGDHYEGDHEEGDHYEAANEPRANICMCHGTFHSTYHSAVGGDPDGARPYRGVRVLQKGATYYNNNPYPVGLPQDCLLCEGLINCEACCHGPCTIGTVADYNAAVASMDSNGGTDGAWNLGLYPCPEEWSFSSETDSPNINDISACEVEITNCAEAVGLCTCAEKRHLMQTLGCSCFQVMRLCDSCYSAWDAIDKYKHCDCVDYAKYYQAPADSA